jgi:hypothetical protein
MALPFIYMAFVEILQLVRFSRSNRDDLAIEVGACSAKRPALATTRPSHPFEV